MKKLLYIIFAFIIAFAIPLTTLAASVTPVEHPGNDANQMDYTPPEGCVRTTLPDSDIAGTHIYKFNNNGVIDPNGTNILTIVVGTAPETSYTQVLSWSWTGSYPLFAIILKGGPAFNLYEYNGTATSDTNLVSPVNASGHPADISHVSVVLCPNGEPPVPPDGNTTCCVIMIILLVIILFLIIFVLILINNLYYNCCCKNHYHCH